MKRITGFLFALLFGAILIFTFSFSSCKSKPVLIEEALPSLVFDKLEADDPAHLTLFFSLEIKNPFPSAGIVTIESWRAELNGKKAPSGFILSGFPDQGFPLVSGFNSFPLVLKMDVDALVREGLAPADDYKVDLITGLSFKFDSHPPGELEVNGIAVFPGIQAPVFRITSIAILKAELINTRFRVGLRINNPNPFPVNLDTFSYELYGNGRLWADGSDKDIVRVPGKSAVEGNLFLIMNFINMKRDLLDQIINLIDVNYRFTGEAQVSTEIDYLPKFTTGFNLSGYSEVLEN